MKRSTCSRLRAGVFLLASTLAGAAGHDQFVHRYRYDGGPPAAFPTPATTLTGVLGTLTPSGGNPTDTLNLAIDMPTTLTDPAQKTITVLVQGSG